MANRSMRDVMQRPMVSQTRAPVPAAAGQATQGMGQTFAPPTPAMPNPSTALPVPGQVAPQRMQPLMPAAPMPGATGPGTGSPGLVLGPQQER